ncbi:MAG: Mu-like prophage major head subunit gpT family protein, partial [Alphaproteobacteria bacterium]|nr:Mu-like prophage major head subunit gpT family protein [Alphaproteobacteria bacterium]
LPFHFNTKIGVEPKLRFYSAVLKEWNGQRSDHPVIMDEITVVNKKYADSIVVKREDVEDDQYGNYGLAMEQLGIAAAQLPDQLIWPLLAKGDTTLCWDKQYFFDDDHPWVDATGKSASISNFQRGTSPMWILADLSQEVRKPIILQRRTPPEFVSRVRPDDPSVFDLDEYKYGVRMRIGVNFGLWQYCYASKAALTAANYKAAFAALEGMRKADGSPLGVRPTHLIVPPTLRDEAARLVQVPFETSLNTNPWANSAKLVVEPYFG